MTLFDIGTELLALNDLCEELPGGEMSPDAEAAFDAWAKQLAEDEGRKLDSYVGLIRTLEGEAAVAKAEAEQFAMRARARENRVRWLKDRMKLHLETTGRAKVQTAAGRTVAVQKNGGETPMQVDLVDVAKVPDEFCVTERRLSRDAVRRHLEAGGELKFARLEIRGTHLRIR